MVQKKRSVPKQNPSQIVAHGIPEVSLVEKITSVVPVKLQPSLRRAIPEPRSTWIRQAILEKLQRMEEEEEEEETS